jgi:hypothetical protein
MLRASPEKISYSSKMDMYSLGLLLAYILLGKDLYPRRIVDGRPDEKAQLETVKRALDEDPESNLQKLKVSHKAICDHLNGRLKAKSYRLCSCQKTST